MLSHDQNQFYLHQAPIVLRQWTKFEDHQLVQTLLIPSGEIMQDRRMDIPTCTQSHTQMDTYFKIPLQTELVGYDNVISIWGE